MSQIQVFGVNADLLPLVVAAVGLLCGSMSGAVFGFGVGLFADLALVQTVGLSSLLYLAVGYWAAGPRAARPAGLARPDRRRGRGDRGGDRRLLDHAAPAGRRRTRHLRARARDRGHDPAQRRHRHPRHGPRPPAPRPRLARGPAPPPAARLHDRRAVPAEADGVSLDPGRRWTGRDRPISPTLALRVAVLGFVAFAIFGVIFFRLWYLQVLSGDQYLAQARDNQTRTQRIAAPRGADRRPPWERARRERGRHGRPARPARSFPRPSARTR